MTTYYVSSSGSDANTGLGPDASHASNKPWATVAKLLGAAGMASGDTAYIFGTFRETVTVAMTSAVAETFVLGDPLNAQGFKDGSGVLLGPGPVRWTSYTTNDTTAPAGSPALNLAGRDFLTFENIAFIGAGASGSCVLATTATSTNITLRSCSFIPGDQSRTTIGATNAADIAFNWIIERCVINIGSSVAGISITVATTNSGAADYDVNFQIKNCLIIGGGNPLVGVTATGTLTFKPGGVDILNSTLVGGAQGFRALTATHLSTTVPCTIYNSVILGTTTALNAATSGQIVEDYNYIPTSTPRTNVTAGANSISDATRAPLFDIGQAWLHGFATRPFMTPSSGSPILGFGNQSGSPDVDAWNRIRPAGGASVSKGLGYLERHGTAVQETSVVQAGASAVKITGPGDHDFLIPVDASSTTITIYARYDTNHAATNKPQVQLLANGAIGVVAETKTMTAAVDTYEQLTFSAFTPTAKGFVTVRCVSRSAAGNGIAYFDTATGGASGSQGFDYFRGAEPLAALVNAAAAAGGAIGAGSLTGGVQ